MTLSIVILISTLTTGMCLADETWWQHDPATPGDWFDETNWSAGVPSLEDSAYVHNSSIAVIAHGNALAKQISIMGSTLCPYSLEQFHASTVLQTGGTATVEQSIYLGGMNEAPGSYTLIGGKLSAADITVGHGLGSGHFTQIGGISNVGGELKVGDLPNDRNYSLDSSLGTYELMGGKVSTGRTSVGQAGRGEFIQTGGVHTVEGTLAIGESRLLLLYPYPWGAITNGSDGSATSNAVYMPSSPSEGRYELSGGQLSTKETVVGKNRGQGDFVQTGGVHTVEEALLIGGARAWGCWSLLVVPADAPGNVIRPCDLFVTTNALEKPMTTNVWYPPPPPAEGRYELSGGRLTAQQEGIGGGRDKGFFKQTGGANRVGYLSINANGRYEYLGGSLKITAGLNLERSFGSHPDGEFDFGGGSTTLAAGSALLNFSHGNLLNAENASITVGPDSLTIFSSDFDPYTQLKRFHTAGLVHFAGSDLILSADQGFSGWGSIDDHVETSGHILATDGGGIDLRSGLFVHEGTVDLGDGRLTVRDDRSGMSGGHLTAIWMDVCSVLPEGVDPFQVIITGPSGLFRQTGGTNTLSAGLSLDNGIYQMNGGSLSANVIIIGTVFGSDSAFIQTGGSVDVQQQLLISGHDANYTIFDGNLTASVLRVGSKSSSKYSHGTLAILGSQAEIEVSQRLSFASGSTFVAVPGSTIHITGPTSLPEQGSDGSTFDILSTDPAALAGMGNLTLIFEGGDEFVATFEVAGEDRGRGLGGFFENFVLDTLQIGGEDVAQVRLVDWIDNQPGWEGSEALYVKNLIIGTDSYLDLNGLNLYYLNFTGPGDAVNLNGGNMRQIPEPATLALLVVGGMLCLGRRQRNRDLSEK